VAKYFEMVLPDGFATDDIVAICAESETLCCSDNPDVSQVLEALDGYVDNAKSYLCAITVLSCLSVKLVNPVFSRSDAIGTVMRKKIKHITDPVLAELQVLRS